MIIYENECCDCVVPGYPCIGDSCSQRHVPHLYCDGCEEKDVPMWSYNGDHLCEECLLKAIKEDCEAVEV